MVLKEGNVLTGGVGFFDSGVGGLSVLAGCQDVLGCLPVYYYGDNARAPYGNRTNIELRAYVREAFSMFEKLRVRAVVVACNTVTALLLDELRRRYEFPIIGIEPAVKPAAKLGGRVLVLATKATCESERLQGLLKQMKEKYPNVEFFIHPCLSLAGKIEQEYLQVAVRQSGAGCVAMDRMGWEWELPSVEVDAVVLGCTHYSLIKKEIANFYSVPVFDGNEGVKKQLEKVLTSGGADVVKNGRGIVENKSKILERKIEENGGVDHFWGFLPLLSNLPWFLPLKNEKKRVFRLRKSSLFEKIKNSRILYFMGSGRSKNRQFYERMFGL